MKNLGAYLLPFAILMAYSFSSITDSGHKGIMIVEAKVIEEVSINKAGKQLDFSELYLIIKQHTYFIKWSESLVTREQLEPFLNKKVKLKVEVKEGLWDTDDPNVQSRIGDYVAILKILDSSSE